MHAIPAMTKLKIIPLQQQHRKKSIRFSVETVGGSLPARNISKAAALTAMPVLIHGAVYMRIFIFPVGNRKNYGERIRSIRNFGKKFCMLFLFILKKNGFRKRQGRFYTGAEKRKMIKFSEGADRKGRRIIKDRREDQDE